MGCDEIKTIEEFNEPEKNEFPQSKNLCIKMFSGVLQKDINFSDCLIKKNEDLEEKLRSFIPTKIVKDDSNVPTFNTRDDILTKSANINFNENYLIALNGVNRVLRVDQENGNYLIIHDNQPGYKNKYIDLLVNKLEGNPEFFYSSPKNPFLDD